jgi:hypothetical protein
VREDENRLDRPAGTDREQVDELRPAAAGNPGGEALPAKLVAVGRELLLEPATCADRAGRPGQAARPARREITGARRGRRRVEGRGQVRGRLKGRRPGDAEEEEQEWEADEKPRAAVEAAVDRALERARPRPAPHGCRRVCGHGPQV